jgi:hypothetical protein
MRVGMADENENDWLQIQLDAASRRDLADRIERHTRAAGDQNPDLPHFLRVLRANRNELLLDKEQGRLVLDVLNVDKRLSALRARLEAFLGER